MRCKPPTQARPSLPPAATSNGAKIPRQLSTPKNYAYLKIAEGCAKQCAFCIIPKIKGPLRSKPQDQSPQRIRCAPLSGRP